GRGRARRGGRGGGSGAAGGRGGRFGRFADGRPAAAGPLVAAGDGHAGFSSVGRRGGPFGSWPPAGAVGVGSDERCKKRGAKQRGGEGLRSTVPARGPAGRAGRGRTSFSADG